jgi:hypothetical protein
MSESPTANRAGWRLDQLEKRMEQLEQYKPAEVSYRLQTLEKRVDSMTKAAWSVAGALVVAAVTFALSVATGQLG